MKTPEPLHALAAAVRERRRHLGLRQDELAALAGCSTSFVHLLEHGKRTVRFDKTLDVLAVLGLDLVITPGSGLVRQADPGFGDGPP